MNIGRFFIDRPVFAIVIALFTVVVGTIAALTLPIAQYPEVVPPTITVTATYPGADARTVADTVATPIEQEINGIENMLYMSSTATNEGRMTLRITFAIGTDLDAAQVLVQNRLAIAEPRLPEETRRQGILVRKNSPDVLILVHMTSPDGSRDQLYVSNYALTRVRDVLARLPGVGDINVLGARDYSMRIWLDPDRIAELGMTAEEVIAAIQQQNVEVTGGALAQPPTPEARAFQPVVTLQGRLTELEQFRDIIIRTGPDGRFARLGDVARIELGAREYTTNAYLNDRSAVVIQVLQAPGSNAVETTAGVTATMERLAQEFPTGVDYRIVLNPTQVVEESIYELNRTIIDAVLLVVAVVLVFLQGWRASLIPILAIPVSLIGTFAAMAALGYSINTLTMLGLVLAVGIVVDDAIVVVENVERYLGEGLSPVEAARKTMDEVGGALVAIALVLTAVFVPTTFLDGMQGEFFRQFAVTIACATLISAFNSLTLSPALSALLLRPHDAHGERRRVGLKAYLILPFVLFAAGFNRVFARLIQAYSRLVHGLMRIPVPMLALYAVLIGLAGWGLSQVPLGFVPQVDRGFLIVNVQLPPGASLERTDATVRRVAAIARETPGVANTAMYAGNSTATQSNNPNGGTVFSVLAPFSERVPQGLTAPRILADLRLRLAAIDEAQVNVLNPPAIQGIGSAGGLALRIEDVAGLGTATLEHSTRDLVAAANADPALVGVFTPFAINSPQLYVDVDRAKAQMLQVPIPRIHDTLRVYLGSAYVNDFNILGRTFQVRAQADGAFRLDPEVISRLKTRSETGAMVPLGSLVTFRDEAGPDRVPRYNLYPTAEISGNAAPGVSSGEAMAALEHLAAQVLPQGLSYEWTELSYLQSQSAGAALLIFPLCVLFVFLVLAAQYESWSLPIAVVMIVPMCLLSAIGGVALYGLDNNLFTQIGLVVLVGLAAKNAILIVEFARQLEADGKSPVAAVIAACRLRLRPILMTSIAFILGVLPMIMAEGAGAELRQAIGVAVFFGMLGVTVFGLLFTPIFYVAVRWLVQRFERKSPRLRQNEPQPMPAE